MPTDKTKTAAPRAARKPAQGNGRVHETSIKKIFESKNPARILTLAPSILSANFADLATDLRRMTRGRCVWTHLDVMDGHFVPNITFGPPMVRSLRAFSSRLFLDAHLMVEKPLEFVEAFADAGVDNLTIHVETLSNPSAALQRVRDCGVRASVVLKPKTPVKAVAAILDEVDMVLVMTVEPGFGGQDLMPATLGKVRELARLRERRGLRFLIQVDGGINVKTAGIAAAAGANVLVAGSAVFGDGHVARNMNALVQAALS